MEEVPGSEESLLAFDEQPALTGQNEEGLLIRLGVVNAALAGLENGHIDPELRELDRRLAVLVGEPTRRAPRLRREPLGIAHVDDKPTLRDGGKPGASVLKPRFVHAADSRSQATAVSPARVSFRQKARPPRSDSWRALLRLPAALSLDHVAHPAVGAVIVDDAARLHGRVDRRRADEAEARLSQALRELDGIRRLRDPLRRRWAVAAVLPHEVV